MAGDGRNFILRRLLALSDVVALVAALAVSGTVINAVGPDALLVEHPWLFVAFVGVWFVIATAIGLYHLPDRRLGHTLADEIGSIAFALTLWSWALLITAVALFDGPVEVLPVAGLWLAAMITVPVGRALTRAISRRCRWYTQRIAVIGTPADTRQVIRRLRRHPELGLEVVRVIESDLAGNGGDPLHLLPDGSRNGNGQLAEALSEAVSRGEVSRVVVASSPGDLGGRTELIRSLTELRIHVDLVSGHSDAIPPRGSLHFIEGLPIVTVAAMTWTRNRIVAKRAFDICAAAIGLTAFSPLLAYYALRIRLDSPGGSLYRSARVGQWREPFRMLKLRTMTSGADARREDLWDRSIHAGGDTPGMFKLRDDPRVTKLGARLRRWSLDELPQLWNVLRGDMSLVGPRPLVPDEATRVGGHYEQRFRVRPGMTGPWQTEGRSEIGLEDMLRLDYAYVANWSLVEDLKLLLRTVGAVIRRHGAY